MCMYTLVRPHRDAEVGHIDTRTHSCTTSVHTCVHMSKVFEGEETDTGGRPSSGRCRSCVGRGPVALLLGPLEVGSSRPEGGSTTGSSPDEGPSPFTPREEMRRTSLPPPSHRTPTPLRSHRRVVLVDGRHGGRGEGRGRGEAGERRSPT